MKTIIRNTTDLDPDDRTALEHVLGERLSDNQQLVIGIVNLARPQEKPRGKPATNGPTLPEWCDVYAGLSDEEITELERAILQRADLTRPS